MHGTPQVHAREWVYRRRKSGAIKGTPGHVSVSDWKNGKKNYC